MNKKVNGDKKNRDGVHRKVVQSSESSSFADMDHSGGANMLQFSSVADVDIL
jgi:hypothetical protein